MKKLDLSQKIILFGTLTMLFGIFFVWNYYSVDTEDIEPVQIQEFFVDTLQNNSKDTTKVLNSLFAVKEDTAAVSLKDTVVKNEDQKVREKDSYHRDKHRSHEYVRPERKKSTAGIVKSAISGFVTLASFITTIYNIVKWFKKRAALKRKKKAAEARRRTKIKPSGKK